MESYTLLYKVHSVVCNRISLNIAVLIEHTYGVNFGTNCQSKVVYDNHVRHILRPDQHLDPLVSKNLQQWHSPDIDNSFFHQPLLMTAHHSDATHYENDTFRIGYVSDT